jgi:HTH-type transcriptional regulator / antitoxin HigA
MILESKNFIAIPPGETIKEQLEDRGMTQKEFAARMGMSEKHISKLINGGVHLMPDVAEKLELVLGVPARFWNKLEAIYQEKLAKVRNENELEEEIEFAKRYPYNKIADWGMVPKTNKWPERVTYLCKYFEVGHLKLLQGGTLMPVICRKLSDTQKSTYITYTLAQYAKVKAREIATAPFCADTLRKKLPQIRALTKRERLDFEAELVDILKSCGVALVCLPSVPGSFLHGITFYDGNTNKIVLGITTRGKYADRFWFSLFHEIGHILEGHIYQEEGTSENDEKSADKMAAEILIPAAELKKFYQEADYSASAIEGFADSLGVGIDIVIGRLQNDKKIGQDRMNRYKKKYEEIAS